MYLTENFKCVAPDILNSKFQKAEIHKVAKVL